jgi:phosphoglycolate phosphatase-like HAD superfamily hydrolase
VASLYARRGIRRNLPSEDRFLEAIGLPAGEFWRSILPREARSFAAEVESEAQDLEAAAFAGGRASMYAGARELLVELSARGTKLALASNCSRRYLEGFVAAFGLEALFAWRRCLESAGAATKAEMVADILRAAGTSRAAMIGDRESDRRAARENGIPFVLFTGGFQPASPEPGDRTAKSYGELRRLLLEG